MQEACRNSMDLITGTFVFGRNKFIASYAFVNRSKDEIYCAPTVTQLVRRVNLFQ